MSETVSVHSRSKEGAQLLLDIICETNRLVPVMEPQLALGRTDSWVARAALPGQEPPTYRPQSRVERQIRRGHR